MCLYKKVVFVRGKKEGVREKVESSYSHEEGKGAGLFNGWEKGVQRKGACVGS